MSRSALRIPTPILAEYTTGDGARDAEVNRVLRVLGIAKAVVSSPTEATARLAGRLRFLARTNDGIDALVAAEAVGDGTEAVVLTSDPDDLRRLLARDPQVLIRIGSRIRDGHRAKRDDRRAERDDYRRCWRRRDEDAGFRVPSR